MRKMISAMLLSMAVSSSHAQTGNTSLHVRYPGRASAGEEITVSCHPDSTKTAIEVVFYVYDSTYQWHVFEQPMRPDGDSLLTRFTVPGAAGFIAYKFLYGNKTDNNDEAGYFTMVVENTGAYSAGAEAGYGLLRSPAYGQGVPGYFSHFSISDTATYMWLSNEILRHHGAAAHLALPYLRAEERYKPGRAPTEMRRAVAYLLRDSSRDTKLTAYLILHNMLKDAIQTDSLKAALLHEYPQGGLAQQLAYIKAVHAVAQDEKLRLCKEFLTAFPYKDNQQRQNDLLGIDYNTIYRAVIAIEIARQHREVVLEYQHTLPLVNILEAYYKAVEIPYDDWRTEDARTIYPYSEALYQRMLYYTGHMPAEYWYYSPTEWKTFCEKTFQSCFRLHARILMELGKLPEALSLAKRAQLTYEYHSADLNQTEALLLEKSHQNNDLDTLLIAATRVNQVTPLMLDMLHKLYADKKDVSQQSFDEWFSSLKNPETQHEIEEQLKISTLHMPAPDFSLKDSEGHTITLSQLKGKVVVLDFWASWCAPCKAAMAGMKLAKDNFKKDTGVLFYFIDTQESQPDYKTRTRDFLKGKGYDFTVLYDNGDKMDRTYAAYAAALHTSGIPFKAVIDAQGVLRFSNNGYKGSPTGLADEIGAMIHAAEKASEETAEKPASYHSDSIIYYNDTIRLGATLTYPANKKASAAIVILSGTGKQDRDGTMAGHKVFAVLADNLTRQGYIVLRSDDRGTGVSTGDYAESTTEDFAADAIAAVHYLHHRTDLQIDRIGLLGHSEGGMSAGIAAAEDTSIGFVITLSAPGTTGLEALLLQNKILVHTSAVPVLNQLRYDSINSLLFHLVATHPASSAAALDTLLRQAYKNWQTWDDSLVAANHLTADDHFFFPLESYIRMATGPWYRTFLAYDPGKILPRVHVPWLAINGDHDLISNGPVNLAGIASNLAKGGNTQMTTWLVPGLNHLYQHCSSCITAEYASLPETFAPEVIARIETWLEQLPPII